MTYITDRYGNTLTRQCPTCGGLVRPTHDSKAMTGGYCSNCLALIDLEPISDAREIEMVKDLAARI